MKFSGGCCWRDIVYLQVVVVIIFNMISHKRSHRIALQPDVPLKATHANFTAMQSLLMVSLWALMATGFLSSCTTTMAAAYCVAKGLTVTCGSSEYSLANLAGVSTPFASFAALFLSVIIDAVSGHTQMIFEHTCTSLKLSMVACPLQLHLTA
jgi:hypothetical protein